MKISKVNHVRYAVCKGPKLYCVSSKNGTNLLDLREHIKKRVDQANKSYNVLIINETTCTKGKKKSDIESINNFSEIKKYFENFNKVCNGILRKDYSKYIDIKKLKNDFEAKITELVNKSNYVSVKKIDLESLVSLYVRKGMREQSEFIVSVIELMCNNKCSDKIYKLTNLNYNGFIDSYKKDYMKKNNSIDKMIKSFNNQKLKVCFDDNNKLCLSNYQDNEKKFLFEFLKEYSYNKDALKKLLDFIKSVYGLHDKEGFFIDVDDVNKLNNLYKSKTEIKKTGCTREEKKIKSEEISESIKELKDNIKGQIKYKLIKAISNNEIYKDELIDNSNQNYDSRIKRETSKYFWLSLTNKYIGDLYSSNKYIKYNNLKNEYVVFNVERRLKDFIASKYIDIGKAVYHFVINNDDSKKDDSAIIKSTNKIITSFDYEYIKARESITKEINTSVVFGSNIFRNSVVNDNYEEDILNDAKLIDNKNNSYVDNLNSKYLYRTNIKDNTNDSTNSNNDESLATNILRFFGGKSNVKNVISDKVNYVEKEIENITVQVLSGDYRYLLVGIAEGMKEIRNNCFHYVLSTKKKQQSISEKKSDYFKVLKDLYNNDVSNQNIITLKKYLGVNAFMFYKDENIIKLINKLYNNYKNIPAYVPAFNNVVKRINYVNDFGIDIKDIEINISNEDNDTDYIENQPNYISTQYFLLKEIYYNDFLQDKYTVNSFLNIFKNINYKVQYIKNFDYVKSDFKYLKEYISFFIEKIYDEKIDKNINNLLILKAFEKENINKNDLDFILKNIDNNNKKDYIIRKLKKISKCFSPIVDFYSRIQNKSYNNISELCQFIMTEYARQNAIANNKGEDASVYEHFKLLLNNGLHETFKQYVLKNYGWIFKDVLHNLIAKPHADLIKEYEPKIKVKLYQTYNDSTFKNFEWYALCKFLPQKQLNLLEGSFKKYKQFIDDIKARLEYFKENEKYPMYLYDKMMDDEIYKNIDSIISIIDLCQMTNGIISEEFSDYYIDENQYAKELGKFIRFKRVEPAQSFFDIPMYCNAINRKKEINCSKCPSNDGICKKLDELRNMKSEHGGLNCVYLNEKEPIILRNIELLRMYGINKVIEECIKEKKLWITEDEYIDYICDINDKKKNTEDEFLEIIENINKKMANSKNSVSQNEIDKLYNYIQRKNRIELNDIQKYSEILYDLYAILISYCYVRERDNMYFLLGFFYVKQNHTNKKVDSSISNIDILEQIINIYQFGGKVRFNQKIDGYNKSNKEFSGTVGTKKRAFDVGYSNYIYAEKNLMNYINNNKISTYAKDFYDEIDKCVKISKIRNDIDHFDYFKTTKYSILELFYFVYVIMFYDLKTQKKVLEKFKNIIKRSFIDIKLDLIYKSDKNKIIDIESATNEEIIIGKSYDNANNKNTTKTSIHSKQFTDNLVELLKYSKKQSQK